MSLKLIQEASSEDKLILRRKKIPLPSRYEIYLICKITQTSRSSCSGGDEQKKISHHLADKTSGVAEEIISNFLPISPVRKLQQQSRCCRQPLRCF